MFQYWNSPLYLYTLLTDCLQDFDVDVLFTCTHKIREMNSNFLVDFNTLL